MRRIEHAAVFFVGGICLQLVEARMADATFMADEMVLAGGLLIRLIVGNRKVSQLSGKWAAHAASGEDRWTVRSADVNITDKSTESCDYITAKRCLFSPNTAACYRRGGSSSNGAAGSAVGFRIGSKLEVIGDQETLFLTRAMIEVPALLGQRGI